jgi:hypothetical protein
MRAASQTGFCSASMVPVSGDDERLCIAAVLHNLTTSAKLSVILGAAYRCP